MKQNLSHFQIPGPFMNPTKKRSTNIGPLTNPDSKFQHGPAKKTFGSAEYESNYGEHRG